MNHKHIELTNLERLSPAVLCDLLNNSGMIGNRPDMFPFIAHAGYKQGQHIFYVVYVDDNEGGYNVSECFVYLGKSGHIEADWSGVSLFGNPVGLNEATKEAAAVAMNGVE